MSKYFRFFLYKKKALMALGFLAICKKKGILCFLFVQKLTFFVITLPKMSLKGVCHTHPQPKTH
jgi:hypothetical protein